jgi:tRNA(Ile)-lysidine synthase
MSKSHSSLTFQRSMLDQFRRVWPVGDWSDLTTLVGVSGGADSVALLRLLSAVAAESDNSGRLMVAHYDHGWRKDSALDAAFVAELASALQLPFILGSATDEADAAEPAARSEHGARALRYAFLTRAAKQQGARFIAVAHTADDQVETILHHVIRGSGLRGLGGMRRSRTIDESLTLMRPLLDFRRAQLVRYLQSLGQSFRVDPANLDPSYTRVRIRRELLPQLRNYNVEVEQSLLRLGSLAAEASLEISRLARDILRDATMASTATCVTISIPALAGITPYLVREMFVELWRDRQWPLQGMSYEKWDLLANLVKQDPRAAASAIHLPGKILVRSEPNTKIELCRPSDVSC